MTVGDGKCPRTRPATFMLQDASGCPKARRRVEGSPRAKWKSSQGRASPNTAVDTFAIKPESSTDQVRKLTNRFGLSQDEQECVCWWGKREGRRLCALQRAGATAGGEREGAIQLVNRQASQHAD